MPKFHFGSLLKLTSTDGEDDASIKDQEASSPKDRGANDGARKFPISVGIIVDVLLNLLFKFVVEIDHFLFKLGLVVFLCIFLVSLLG
jgi:hypothetical protein